ncbi:MAG: LON peptidase substrate-binding domain-containing protein [Hyphomicrobiaceae bacterium]
MATTDRYRRPSDLPRKVPVFPLRKAILLPRATLPLNVFEPRYLKMIDDAIRRDRVIAIVQPDVAGDEPAMESPPGKDVRLKRVGCLGRLTAYQELDDGRIIATLTGIARFRLLDEPATDAPYRLINVDYDPYVIDFSPGYGEDDVDRDGLLKVLHRYLDATRLKADWRTILESTTEFLVNALSVMSPYGPVEKQALLEAATLTQRAEILVALAEMELASSGSQGGTLQ